MLKKKKKKLNSKKKIKKKKNFQRKKIQNRKILMKQKMIILELTKLNEQKPEIKKIKKQDTEKKVYKVKEYVVYPKHGVGQITEFKKINIGGIEVETYMLKI